MNKKLDSIRHWVHDAGGVLVIVVVVLFAYYNVVSGRAVKETEITELRHANDSLTRALSVAHSVIVESHNCALWGHTLKSCNGYKEKEVE